MLLVPISRNILRNGGRGRVGCNPIILTAVLDKLKQALQMNIYLDGQDILGPVELNRSVSRLLLRIIGILSSTAPQIETN